MGCLVMLDQIQCLCSSRCLACFVFKIGFFVVLFLFCCMTKAVVYIPGVFQSSVKFSENT